MKYTNIVQTLRLGRLDLKPSDYRSVRRTDQVVCSPAWYFGTPRHDVA